MRDASAGGYLPVVKFLASLPSVDITSNNQVIRLAHYYKRNDIVKFLLAIGPYSLDIKAKYLGLPEEKAKKVVEKEQYNYLLDQKALDMCRALKHLSLLEMITIIDASIKYAENIPFNVKWNFLEKCKHFQKESSESQKTRRVRKVRKTRKTE